MNRKVFIVTMFVAILVMALAGTASAQTTTPITMTLIDHAGNPLGGGQVSFYPNQHGGYQACPGLTDDTTGKLTCDVPVGYKHLTMSLHGTSIQMDPVALAMVDFTWQTAEVVIELRDSTGALITAPDDNSGGQVQMYHGGYYTKGYTGTDGIFKIEIFPNNDIAKNPKFYLNYRWGTNSVTDVQIFAGTQTIVFQTAKVQLFHSGNISYYKGGYRAFTKPSMELLPGVYDFRFSDFDPADFTVTAAGMSKLVNVLELKDSNGAGLAGGTARGGNGANFGTWHVAGGPTTSNGVLFDIRDATSPPGNMSYEMNVNNTTQVKTQNAGTASVYKFKTILLTLKLETCGAEPLSGGAARYGAGATSTTWHFPGGPTNASGETSAQVLPGGQRSFEMGYKATAQNYPGNPVTIPNSNTTLTWQTTKVTLNWPGSISYGGPAGVSTWFTKPSMELLAGTYNFKLYGPPDQLVPITISGCDMTKSYVLLKVLDENGAGVAGGVAIPAYGGSWGNALPGSTDANGNLFSEITPGYTKIKMVVNQGSREQTAAELAVSNNTWYTEILRIWLKDHSGVAITDESGFLSQGGGVWYDWGYLNSTGYKDIQLFPGSYKFRMGYNATQQTINPIMVSIGPGLDEFSFQTGQVFGSCITQYVGNGWSAFTDGMQQMPGTRNFRYPQQSGVVTAGGVTNLNCP